MGTLFTLLFSLVISVNSLPQITDPPVKIAAFNIQVLGSSKLRNDVAVKTLIKVLQRYDLVMVQEIRDSSENAFPALVEATNKLSPQNRFKFVVSKRLGRSVSKEQYAFMYRENVLELVDTYQFEDGIDDGNDTFEREPFAALFHSWTTELSEFALIVTHIAPRDAVKEIGALTDVYHAVEKLWKIKTILLAGDFNADCTYVRQSEWKNVALRTDPRFHWLLPDSADTTTGDTDCSYDRFVTASTTLRKNIVPGSVKAHRFDMELGITQEEAKAVSDHFPIELQLRGPVNEDYEKMFRTGLSYVVSGLESVDVKLIRNIYRFPEPYLAGFEVQVFKEDSRMHHVTATSSKNRDVMKSLFKFEEYFPGVLSDKHLSLVNEYSMANAFPSNMFINGLDIQDSNSYDVTITCRLQTPTTCDVTVTKFFT